MTFPQLHIYTGIPDHVKLIVMGWEVTSSMQLTGIYFGQCTGDGTIKCSSEAMGWLDMAADFVFFTKKMSAQDLWQRKG